MYKRKGRLNGLNLSNHSDGLLYFQAGIITSGDIRHPAEILDSSGFTAFLR